MKCGGTITAQLCGHAAGLNSCTPEGFVDVDISETADGGLVQQERFDGSPAVSGGLEELGGGDVERVSAQPGDSFGYLGTPFYASELANIVVEERQAVAGKNRASVGGAAGIEEQLSRHAEMDDHDSAIKDEDDELTAAFDATNGLAGEALGDRFAVVPQDEGGEELREVNVTALEAGRQRANDGFNFGQLRHSSDLREVEIDFAAVDADRDLVDYYIGIKIVLAGTAVEFPGVPRADQHIVVQGAFPERSALMWTDAV